MTQQYIQQHPRYLWFFILSYTMVLVLSNWFDARLVQVLSLTTTPGTLIFPLTFLLSDLITEVYGYKHARRAIWCGLLFNAIFILYGQLVIHLPSPEFAQTKNAAFDSLFSFNTRIIIASGISYLISEPLNSFVMAKLKIKMKGGYIGIRFVLSTVVASGIDSLFFTTIAFYGTMPTEKLIIFILTMWLLKVSIEFLGLPISIRLCKKMKQLEKLDVYDYNTSFNIFELETKYSQKSNKFLS